jgi:hypothetical protein
MCTRSIPNFKVTITGKDGAVLESRVIKARR